MQLSVGTVVEGKVSKITNFGAFINIDGGGSKRLRFRKKLLSLQRIH